MNRPVLPDRRSVLKGGGALIVSFSLGDAFAQDQNAPAAPPPPKPPGSLEKAPYLDSWIRIDADGAITVFTGKAELGQGFKTAFQQIAAEELDVPFESLKIVTADTQLTANEGYTAGSHSMQDSGTAIQNAAAQVREMLVTEAARRRDLPPENFRTEDGVVISPDGERFGYGELIPAELLHVRAQPKSNLKDPATFKVMGQSLPRVDIPAKVTGGAAYVQDMRLPGMVHARIVRPPSYGAQLTECDTSAIEKLPGVVKVVRDGNFLAVVAAKEFQAIKAMTALSAVAKWKETARLPKQDDLLRVLTGLPSQDKTIFEQKQSGCDRPEDHRGDLYQALSIAWIDRSFLRGGAIRRRCDDGVDSHARGLSRPPGYRGNAADAAGERPLHPRRRLRVLWPQRCRRCRGGRRPDRARDTRYACPRAMDARAGARLGALWSGNGDQVKGFARRQWCDCGLEFRGLEQHPFDAAGRRRFDAGGTAHGATVRGAGAQTAAVAGRRR